MNFSRHAISTALLLGGLLTAPEAAAQSSGFGGDNNMSSYAIILATKQRACWNLHRPAEDRITACTWVANRQKTTGSMVNLSYVLRLAGKYDDALTALANADPSNPDVLFYRAQIYVVRGNFDQADADANRIVSLYPQNATSYSDRCWIRGIAGKDLDAALADCNKGLTLAPNDSDVLDSRGMVDYKRGDLKAAIADYSAALAPHADVPSSLYMRAVAECQSGDAASGKKDLSAAQELNPFIADEFVTYGVKKPVCGPG